MALVVSPEVLSLDLGEGEGRVSENEESGMIMCVGEVEELPEVEELER